MIFTLKGARSSRLIEAGAEPTMIGSLTAALIALICSSDSRPTTKIASMPVFS
jgi:hypothetical protein